MIHQKIYDAIIENAKKQGRKYFRRNSPNYTTYYEKHHIIPKCLGGTNDEENLILLTAKEHFVCHKLLTYIYKENRKIAYAFHRMAFSKKYGKIVSSRDYAYCVELIKSIPVSKETKEKQSMSRKGKKFTKEHKLNLQRAVKNAKDNASKEEKKRRHEYVAGEKNGMYGVFGDKHPMFGKHHSIDAKNSIREKNRIIFSGKGNPMYGIHLEKILCPHCNRLIDKRNYARWHGNKCKINILI